MKNFGKSSRVHSQGVQKIFMAPIYGAHCAVIFATAQLSCFTIREPEYSSFYMYKYLVHHEIRKGSPRARAISETGVGTNWRFWRFFDQ